MTVALLFPGQGAQSEGLLHHLPQHTEVTRTIKEASDVLGVNIGALDSRGAALDRRGTACAVDRRRGYGPRRWPTTSTPLRSLACRSAPLARRSPAARCPLPMPCRSSICGAS